MLNCNIQIPKCPTPYERILYSLYILLGYFWRIYFCHSREGVAKPSSYTTGNLHLTHFYGYDWLSQISENPWLADGFQISIYWCLMFYNVFKTTILGTVVLKPPITKLRRNSRMTICSASSQFHPVLIWGFPWIPKKRWYEVPQNGWFLMNKFY